MLIDLPTAKTHSAIDADADDAKVTDCILGAERFAVEYLRRNIYADKAALDAAIAAVPDAIAAAKSAYDAAMLAADAMTDGDLKAMAEFAAEEAYLNAKQSARMTYQGIIFNDQIKVAMLLTIGSLYMQRENEIIGATVALMPMSALFHLDFHRAY